MSCHWRELGHIQICWAVTDGLWYLGYSTLTVAPDPTIEWVTRAIHSVGGRSSTHRSLRVLTRDLVVRPWGWNVHGHDSESRGGTNHVAHEAAAELEAQTEAKFHMYYFSFR
jgi:hypothetical protein